MPFIQNDVTPTKLLMCIRDGIQVRNVVGYQALLDMDTLHGIVLKVR